MALIRCPECRKEVSDTAEACPHCGFKIEKQELLSFVPEKTILYNSKPTAKEIIKSVVSIVLGLPLCVLGIGYGFLPVLIGVIFIGAGVLFLFANKEGECPYCGQLLRLSRGDALNHGIYAVKCPYCNNTITKTKTHLLTTHSAEE